jgi:hypothetical protein
MVRRRTEPVARWSSMAWSRPFVEGGAEADVDADEGSVVTGAVGGGAVVWQPRHAVASSTDREHSHQRRNHVMAISFPPSRPTDVQNVSDRREKASATEKEPEVIPRNPERADSVIVQAQMHQVSGHRS